MSRTLLLYYDLYSSCLLPALVSFRTKQLIPRHDLNTTVVNKNTVQSMSICMSNPINETHCIYKKYSSNTAYIAVIVLVLETTVPQGG